MLAMLILISKGHVFLITIYSFISSFTIALSSFLILSSKLLNLFNLYYKDVFLTTHSNIADAFHLRNPSISKETWKSFMNIYKLNMTFMMFLFVMSPHL